MSIDLHEEAELFSISSMLITAGSGLEKLTKGIKPNEFENQQIEFTSNLISGINYNPVTPEMCVTATQLRPLFYRIANPNYYKTVYEALESKDKKEFPKIKEILHTASQRILARITGNGIGRGYI